MSINVIFILQGIVVLARDIFIKLNINCLAFINRGHICWRKWGHHVSNSLPLPLIKQRSRLQCRQYLQAETQRPLLHLPEPIEMAEMQTLGQDVSRALDICFLLMELQEWNDDMVRITHSRLEIYVPYFYTTSWRRPFISYSHSSERQKFMCTVVGRKLYQSFGISEICSFLEKLVHWLAGLTCACTLCVR